MGDPVPSEIHEVLGENLLRRLATLQPLLPSLGDQTDQRLCIERDELRIMTELDELRQQERLDLSSDLQKQRSERTLVGVAQEDAKPIRALIDVVEERHGPAFHIFA